MDKLITLFFAAILTASMAALPAHAAKPVDNDHDGYKSNVDCDDNNPAVNPGAAEICDNGIDDDCDGAIDTADPDCGGGCTPTENPEVSCSDGVDNDCDGAIDAADTDCGGGCTPTENPEVSCADGVDNDCDGATDSADSDCATGGACADYLTKGDCTADASCEWIGNPRNGYCQDAACTPTENPEASCSDGVDNDCDGAIDSADSDCATTSNRDVIVMASNDLGMHCACPGAQYMLLLPPFNTLRAQVIERDVNNERSGTPLVLADPSDIRVEYNIVENDDDFLKTQDTYYPTWIQMMPRYGFGPAIDPADGKIQGLTGSKLAGEMEAEPEGWWEAVGVPAFPDESNASSSQEKIMIDPLGGPDRNPYLTGNIKVIEQASGALLAETNITVPVSFGGCCDCHLDLAENTPGYGRDPESSFQLMGFLHSRDSGINFADPTVLNPDRATEIAEGEPVTPGPVRCSVCHWDPAMGESAAPGGYVHATTGAPLPTSQYSFSDVLHRWHVENSTVLSYDPDLATDCYQCHPSNEVNCYRGQHTLQTIGQDNHAVWCTDCHGDLYQRVAEGQMDNPWSEATLPKCQDCHNGTGENGSLSAFGGSFLKSMAHKSNAILCSTCHGSPHSLNPSTLAKDNQQNVDLQEAFVGQQQGAHAIGVCDVCHVGRSSAYGKPNH